MSVKSSEAASNKTYFGWQSEKVNFMFGLTAQRSALLGLSALAGIWPIAITSFATALVAWPLAIVCALMAVVRIQGRTSDEWIVAAVSYQLVRLRGHHRFAGGVEVPRHQHLAAITHAETTTEVSGVDTDTDVSDEEGKSGHSGDETSEDEAEDAVAISDFTPSRGVDLPGVLAPLKILESPTADGPLGVVFHRLDRTYTAIARVRFPGIGLVDSDRRDQRVSGWGGLLASLCTEGNPFVRVQAMQRLLPESGAALRRWHVDHLDEAAPDIATTVTQSLLQTATLATSQREAFLAFSLDARRAASAIKTAGGGQKGALIVLGRQLRSLTSAIANADLQVETWLDPRDVGEVIRTAYDPHSGRGLADRRASCDKNNLQPGVDPGVAGPAGAQADAGYYAHDGAFSTTYWVYDWPRSQTFSTVLGPLLGEGAHRRGFAMHYSPLSPREAEKEVMRERTARSVAVRMRQRTGQVVPEHEQAALERAAAQDAERAAGHGIVRFSGYLTVTVTDLEELETACAELEADAAAARVEIRRMWMAQDIGFAASALPLGFMPERKRW